MPYPVLGRIGSHIHGRLPCIGAFPLVGVIIPPVRIGFRFPCRVKVYTVLLESAWDAQIRVSWSEDYFKVSRIRHLSRLGPHRIARVIAVAHERTATCPQNLFSCGDAVTPHQIAVSIRIFGYRVCVRTTVRLCRLAVGSGEHRALERTHAILQHVDGFRILQPLVAVEVERHLLVLLGHTYSIADVIGFSGSVIHLIGHRHVRRQFGQLHHILAVVRKHRTAHRSRTQLTFTVQYDVPQTWTKLVYHRIRSCNHLIDGEREVFVVQHASEHTIHRDRDRQCACRLLGDAVNLHTVHRSLGRNGHHTMYRSETFLFFFGQLVLCLPVGIRELVLHGHTFGRGDFHLAQFEFFRACPHADGSPHGQTEKHRSVAVASHGIHFIVHVCHNRTLAVRHRCNMIRQREHRLALTVHHHLHVAVLRVRHRCNHNHTVHHHRRTAHRCQTDYITSLVCRKRVGERRRTFHGIHRGSQVIHGSDDVLAFGNYVLTVRNHIHQLLLTADYLTLVINHHDTFVVRKRNRVSVLTLHFLLLLRSELEYTTRDVHVVLERAVALHRISTDGQPVNITELGINIPVGVNLPCIDFIEVTLVGTCRVSRSLSALVNEVAVHSKLHALARMHRCAVLQAVSELEFPRLIHKNVSRCKVAGREPI